jgi:hypothetical protein
MLVSGTSFLRGFIVYIATLVIADAFDLSRILSVFAGWMAYSIYRTWDQGRVR